MAFDKTAKSIDTSSKSIVLVALDISRTDDSRYVPHPITLFLTQPNGTGKDDAIGFHITEGTDAVPENGHNVYLARVALAPGQYKVIDVFGDANAFPFHGWFTIPILQPLVVTPGSITYIGRVKATLREKHDGEFRAGPLLPLIDQSVTGISGSTWDVSIENAAEKDLAAFRATFPVLSSAQIVTAPLPAFDRDAAQRWWEGTEQPAK